MDTTLGMLIKTQRRKVFEGVITIVDQSAGLCADFYCAYVFPSNLDSGLIRVETYPGRESILELKLEPDSQGVCDETAFENLSSKETVFFGIASKFMGQTGEMSANPNVGLQRAYALKVDDQDTLKMLHEFMGPIPDPKKN